MVIVIPNLKVTKRWTIQTILWFRMPTIKIQQWPYTKAYRPKSGKPLFYSLHLGIVEFRWFDNNWGD